MDENASDARALAVPSNRLSRFGRLGGMTAGIAGNMAVQGIAQLGRGQKPALRDLLLTPPNITRVADQLAKMRGAAMKIGQLVSMDTGEVLPPELAQIMARLRDDAHFMPPAQLKQVLNTQWRTEWMRSFQRFNVRPIAAASIGQVHRAQLKDGRDVAIKVQYPGVAKSIDSDVANVGALMRLSGLLPKGFELAPYLEEARKQLHEETDYIREAQQLERYGRQMANSSTFCVPEHHKDWSTDDILTMSFVDGIAIEDTVNLSQEARNQIAERLIDLTLQEMFVFGFMQTDPNFANYRYEQETGRIILLDFGAARDLNPGVIDQYRRLLRAGLDGDAVTLRDIALEIGFFAQNTQATHQEAVVEMMQLVFYALRQHRPFDFVANDLSAQMQHKGMKLAESGFVPPPLPIDILLVQRKLGGVFLLAKRLGAKLDIVALLEASLS